MRHAAYEAVWMVVALVVYFLDWPSHGSNVERARERERSRPEATTIQSFGL